MSHERKRPDAEYRYIRPDTAPTDAFTGGGRPGRMLYHALRDSLRRAERIDLLVSFLMESGVHMILEDLREAADRGAAIRILTGDYLGITQPSALYLLKDGLGDRVDLRFYADRTRSFHPKAYFFDDGKEREVYIGSSNMSKSAWLDGIEWNYRLRETTDREAYSSFRETFEKLFAEHSFVIDDEALHRYRKQWKKPAVYRILPTEEEPEEKEKVALPEQGYSLFRPRGAQIEALYALKESRADGARRGLVTAATGLGKTFLAAFDSADRSRVLFVAHQEELLKQARDTFRKVRGNPSQGFFHADEKNTTAEVILASVFTLGKPEYLTEEYFARDAFDYVVIDEFHHAVTDSYRRIVDYFQPDFLLGLTATPERLDGRNIYALCDYNVPYEITLKEGINRGLLVPFRYYGVYDETDYSGLTVRRGKYDEAELTDLYIEGIRAKKRDALIERHYRKHRKRKGRMRALGFCSSRRHAEHMAAVFTEQGITAAAVYSDAQGPHAMERDAALESLRTGETEILFSVNMFNEGVDIPDLDLVLFLRPTESPVVFLQQLGRGLRTAPGKEYLVVLDFIGNYKKAALAPILLAGNHGRTGITTGARETVEYPDDCIVDFDLELIDLFEEQERRTAVGKLQVREEFERVRELLGGRVPSRTELFQEMEDTVYEYCKRHADRNPFRDYLGFLDSVGALSPEEKRLRESVGGDFLKFLETTNMSKVYKMPVLYGFCSSVPVRMALTEEELLTSWKDFFDHGTNWRDFPNVTDRAGYLAMTDRQHLKKAKEMPVRVLKDTGRGFFREAEGTVLALRPELEKVTGCPEFARHMRDILDFRTMEYYRRRYMDSEDVL